MSVTEDLMQALGCQTRRELAEKVGTSPQRVSMWDSKGMPAWAILAVRDLLDNAGVEVPESLEAEHRRVTERRLQGAA